MNYKKILALSFILWTILTPHSLLSFAQDSIESSPQIRRQVLVDIPSADAEAGALADALAQQGIKKIFVTQVGSKPPRELDVVLRVLYSKGIEIEYQNLTQEAWNKINPKSITPIANYRYHSEDLSRDQDEGFSIAEPTSNSIFKNTLIRFKHRLGIVQYRSYFGKEGFLLAPSHPTWVQRIMRFTNFLIRGGVTSGGIIIGLTRLQPGDVNSQVWILPAIVNLVAQFILEYFPGKNLSYKSQGIEFDYKKATFSFNRWFMTLVSWLQSMGISSAVVLSSGGEVSDLWGVVALSTGSLLINIPLQIWLQNSRAKENKSDPSQVENASTGFYTKVLVSTALTNIPVGFKGPIAKWIAEHPLQLNWSGLQEYESKAIALAVASAVVAGGVLALKKTSSTTTNNALCETVLSLEPLSYGDVLTGLE